MLCEHVCVCGYDTHTHTMCRYSDLYTREGLKNLEFFVALKCSSVHRSYSASLEINETAMHALLSVSSQVNHH